MKRTDGIFQDLLNIEVNTIIKPSMTAEKMPAVPFALLDIIETYAFALAERGVDVQVYFNKQVALDHSAKHLWDTIGHTEPLPITGRPMSFSMAEVTNGWDSFERLRIAALEALEQLTNEQDKVLIQRIVSSCSRIKYVVQGLQLEPPQPRAPDEARFEQLIPRTRLQLLDDDLRKKRMPRMVDSEELGMIRKCWEVGVERVLLQTCVQIDGDVVTRIAEELVGETNALRRELLLETHKRSVEIGLGHWRSLVQVAVELFGKVFAKLTG